MNQNKTPSRGPLLHVVKRPERSGRQMLLFRLGAVALSILAGGLFILAIGYNPIEIYGTILNGAFRSKIAVQSTIKITIPLCISALGATLAFKMKFWNIGGEGQIIMGGVFATYFALLHADWPHLPLMVVCFLAGLIGGGVWGLIPALFKVKWNTNETLLTLMLNYIALYIISWLQNGPWRDPAANGFPKIAAFAKNAVLGKVLGVPVETPLDLKNPGRPQKELTREERLRNAKGAFACQSGADLSGKRVLLVDDIITTGATVSACAMALMQAGAVDVTVVSIAAAEERANGKGKTNRKKKKPSLFQG